ncbi:MAG: fatty-acid synthase [Desulfobacteraceae bacterium IS3]|nr:MAG: fatty-acid synthase [Desulfobacteraceae bacterium IS3]
MSKRDIYHDTVKRALEKDGWKITHDPFPLEIGEKALSADLGAERLISAEKGLKKIVVEIKSFLGRSDVKDLQQTIGQYVMYLRVLIKNNIRRELYLAVPERTFEAVFTIELGQLFLEDNFIRLIVFDDEKEVITKWIPD